MAVALTANKARRDTGESSQNEVITELRCKVIAIVWRSL